MEDIKEQSASEKEEIVDNAASEHVAKLAGVRLYLVIVCLLLTLFLSAINVTVVATALPGQWWHIGSGDYSHR